MLETLVQALDVHFAPQTVFVLDTGAVFRNERLNIADGISNGLDTLCYLPLEQFHSEIRHMANLLELIDTPRFSCIIPHEVRMEIEEYISYLKNRESLMKEADARINQTHLRARYRQEREKLKRLSAYISILDYFQQENFGYDPRNTDAKKHRIDSVSIDSDVYERAWEHYFYAAMAGHMRKGLRLSEADIAVATLSYVIQQQEREVCIITHDHDFEHMALTTFPYARLVEKSTEEGRIAIITTPSYKVTTYMPAI